MLGFGTLLKYGLLVRRGIGSIGKGSLVQQQTKTLRRLLQQAKDTAFGRHYDFNALLALPDQQLLEAYRQRVPLFDYDSIYDAWWHRMLKGEADVCWRGKVRNFSLSSGTSGAPTKYIPVSDEMLRAMRRTTIHMFSQSTNFGFPTSFYGGQFLMISSCTQMRPYEEGKNDVWVGDVSGINAGRMPRWFENFYKPGQAIAALPNWDLRLEAIVKNARDWDIKLIAGIPSWVQMMLEAIVSHYKLKNIHEIWPNLQAYTSGGVSFLPYRRRFEQLMGKPILYLDTYYTSEGSLACQTRLDADRMPMELLLDNGIYFEFVPFNDENFPNGALNPSAKTLHIGEVEEGVSYAILLSTCAGAWRYLLGDTVKFVDKQRGDIVITGRTKHFLSICGEHLSVENMNQGISAAEARHHYAFPEFTVKAVKVDNHFEHHWYLGVHGDQTPSSSEQAAILATLDETLCAVNDDYATERKDNLLHHVRLNFLPVSAFYAWHAAQGKSGGQTKFPRVMTDSQYEQWTKFITPYLPLASQ